MSGIDISQKKALFDVLLGGKGVTDIVSHLNNSALLNGAVDSELVELGGEHGGDQVFRVTQNESTAIQTRFFVSIACDCDCKGCLKRVERCDKGTYLKRSPVEAALLLATIFLTSRTCKTTGSLKLPA